MAVIRYSAASDNRADSPAVWMSDPRDSNFLTVDSDICTTGATRASLFYGQGEALGAGFSENIKI